MLTLTQIELVQKHFRHRRPDCRRCGGALLPAAVRNRPQPRADVQGRHGGAAPKLMQMLTAAVKGLARLDRLVPVVEDLGRRHADTAWLDKHYDTVGAALLWTLEKGLGAAFTPEVQGRVGHGVRRARRRR